jgi:hypothetical protein
MPQKPGDKLRVFLSANSLTEVSQDEFENAAMSGDLAT